MKAELELIDTSGNEEGDRRGVVVSATQQVITLQEREGSIVLFCS